MGNSDSYNIFVSWSGAPSKRAAEALRQWLPYIVRDASVWISTEDIAKGANWSAEISSRLADCKIGVIVLTPENQSAPWLLFEAGALYKGLADRSICTLLIGFKPPITGPLGLFQATLPSEKDFLKLCRDVDVALGGNSGSKVDILFERFWPDLEKELAEASKEVTKGKKVESPSQEKILEEILNLVQQMARRTESHIVPGRAFRAVTASPTRRSWEPRPRELLQTIDVPDRIEFLQRLDHAATELFKRDKLPRSEVIQIDDWILRIRFTGEESEERPFYCVESAEGCAR